jgi:hypothetical protein
MSAGLDELRRLSAADAHESAVEGEVVLAVLKVVASCCILQCIEMLLERQQGLVIDPIDGVACGCKLERLADAIDLGKVSSRQRRNDIPPPIELDDQPFADKLANCLTDRPAARAEPLSQIGLDQL